MFSQLQNVKALLHPVMHGTMSGLRAKNWPRSEMHARGKSFYWWLQTHCIAGSLKTGQPIFRYDLAVTIGSMTNAPATIAPMKYLRAKPNIKSISKQNHYPNSNPHIKLNLKPYHNPNPNPNSLEKLRPV